MKKIFLLGLLTLSFLFVDGQSSLQISFGYVSPYDDFGKKSPEETEGFVAIPTMKHSYANAGFSGHLGYTYMVNKILGVRVQAGYSRNAMDIEKFTLDYYGEDVEYDLRGSYQIIEGLGGIQLGYQFKRIGIFAFGMAGYAQHFSIKPEFETDFLFSTNPPLFFQVDVEMAAPQKGGMAFRTGVNLNFVVSDNLKIFLEGSYFQFDYQETGSIEYDLGQFQSFESFLPSEWELDYRVQNMSLQLGLSVEL